MEQDGAIGLFVLRAAPLPGAGLLRHGHPGMYLCLDPVRVSRHCTKRPEVSKSTLPPPPLEGELSVQAGQKASISCSPFRIDV